MKKIVPQNDLSAADKDSCQTLVDEAVASSFLEEILIQASDPETSPAILSTLSNHQEKEVCRRVAENPNTPEKVLKELWIRYPLAMMVNPIVAFRFLAGSKSFDKDLQMEVRLALYEALCSEGRFSEMEAHVPERTRCVWFNCRLEWIHGTNPQKYTICRDEGREYCQLESIVKTNVAPFSDLLDFSKRLYGHLAVDPCSSVRKLAAKWLDPDFFLPLATDEDVEVRLALAERVPEHTVEHEVCEILSRDPSAEVRKAIAHSSNLPSSVHERLAEDPSRDVRVTLAGTGGCIDGEEGGWRTLVEGGKELSVLVASNKCCPKSVLIDLVSHSAADVRLSAWNTYAFEKEETKKETDQLNALLAVPSRVKERMVVAASPTITGKICRRLMGAEVEVTRVLAKNGYISNADRIALILGSDEQTSLLAVKCSASVPVLRAGSSHPSITTIHSTNLTVAWVPVLRAASTHPSAAVRALIFEKGMKAIQIIPDLVKSSSNLVRQSVCDYLTKSIDREYSSATRDQVLESLSKDPLESIRLDVAQFVYVGGKILDDLSQDESVKVRLAVAEHLYARDETLDRLSQDDSVDVRVKISERWYLSDTILDCLSQDSSVEVRVNVAGCFSLFSRAICDRLKIEFSWRDKIVPSYWVDGYRGVNDIGVAEMLEKENLLHLRLARDVSPKVRTAVATSPWTSPEALAVLIDDGDNDVREALLARTLPRTTAHQDRWCERFRVQGGGSLGDHENPYIRAIVANQRLTGKRLLRRLAEDECWYVQAIVKRHLS